MLPLRLPHVKREVFRPLYWTGAHLRHSGGVMGEAKGGPIL